MHEVLQPLNMDSLKHFCNILRWKATHNKDVGNAMNIFQIKIYAPKFKDDKKTIDRSLAALVQSTYDDSSYSCDPFKGQPHYKLDEVLKLNQICY